MNKFEELGKKRVEAIAEKKDRAKERLAKARERLSNPRELWQTSREAVLDKVREKGEAVRENTVARLAFYETKLRAKARQLSEINVRGKLKGAGKSVMYHALAADEILKAGAEKGLKAYGGMFDRLHKKIGDGALGLGEFSVSEKMVSPLDLAENRIHLLRKKTANRKGVFDTAIGALGGAVGTLIKETWKATDPNAERKGRRQELNTRLEKYRLAQIRLALAAKRAGIPLESAAEDTTEMLITAAVDKRRRAI